MLININNSESFEEVIKDGLTLVDFYATWCGPCKMLSPVVEQISDEFEGAKFIKVDVDEMADIAVRYKIEVVPTLIVFKNGSELRRSSGYREKEGVLALLREEDV